MATIPAVLDTMYALVCGAPAYLGTKENRLQSCKRIYKEARWDDQNVNGKLSSENILPPKKNAALQFTSEGQNLTSQ